MKVEEKSSLYENYLTTHFQKIHKGDKEFTYLYQYYRKNYLKLLPQDKTIRILEIGSGMGHFLYFLEKNGYSNNLGIDISPENVNFCKELGFNVSYANVFEFLAEESHSYDVIIMNDVLEHFEKNEIIQLLNLIFDRLHDSGRLIMKIPNASNPIMASSTRYYDFTHEILFTEESISQLLKNTRYSNISLYPQNIYVFYYNPINYVAMAASKILNVTFRLLFLLHGRKTTKIFTKDIITVSEKNLK